MRRRQAYAIKEQSENAEQLRDEPKSVKKGVCPKCGEHIGRGVGLHARRCKGKE